MASLGVLASLLPHYPQSMPVYDPMNAYRLAGAEQLLQTRDTSNRTALLDLAELQRQLGTQEAARQYQREHPWTVLGGQPPGGAGATALGGIGPAQMPAAGPITQGPLPGMGGQTQTVPGYPDLSRYAAVSPAGGGPLPADVGMPTVPPPQSTLAQLGPARHPLEALTRRNPDAARLVLAQQQAQETQRLTAQENLLKFRLTEAGAVAQLLQGATAGNWDVVKARVSEIAPQMGARLPQQYSKEAVQPYLESAVSVEKNATLGIETLKSQADLLKARMSGRVASTDQYLKALGVRPGEETPEDMANALAWEQRDKQTLSASHGTGQIVQTPGGYMRINPQTNQPEVIQAPGGGPLYPKPTEAEQRAQSFGERASDAHRTTTELEDKGVTPSVWAKVGESLPFGVGNYLVGEDRQRYQQAQRKFIEAHLRKESGAAIHREEYADTERTYFPQPGDSPATLAQKRASREARLRELQAEGAQTGRQQPASRAQASQAPASTGPRLLTAAELQGLADARRKALGRPVTVEEVTKDLDPSKFRTQ